jgi:hypothetical protein
MGMSTRNKSGFKGVTWMKRNKKWRAQIGIDHKSVFLGLFPSAKEAHVAYCEAAKRIYGNFANFGTKEIA